MQHVVLIIQYKIRCSVSHAIHYYNNMDYSGVISLSGHGQVGMALSEVASMQLDRWIMSTGLELTKLVG